ncbi:Exodeoxyribonuclease VII large subunit [Desulfurella multipotens]|uniref:Exodeoxyribonuclease 7 large subunit n=1 Tax=Desulfurella multipotens TaxID=79269 RepID=A0A1G6IUW7_9BACT|nr:exodeoxyribonuclease VII large subunit [Desulfurella multipotens]SDC10213.1 Exodeoxyribonuclease VII large subunit [Desulfurella multipotens]
MKPLSVFELTKQIKDLLEWNFNEVFVEGEISNLKISSAQHVYFNLVDQKARLMCVIFKSNIDENVKKQLVNGQKVIALGRISLYEPHGQYHLVISYIQSIGDGLKYKKLEEDKKFLLEKGYLENKKPLPFFPKKVIIITSLQAAALKDILNILKRRSPGLEILIYPATVQGENAKKEILKAIEFVNENYAKLSLDVCILTRGGGSVDELWIFNDLDIAIAFKNCKIPTISAIGHQIDQTLCDLVADKIAETPSAAAEILTKAYVDLHKTVLMLKKSIFSNFYRILNSKKANFESLKLTKIIKLVENYIEVNMLKIDNFSALLEHRIQNIIFNKSKKIKSLENRIKLQNPIAKLNTQKIAYLKFQNLIVSNMQVLLEKKKHTLLNLTAKITALSPKNVLKRGFSITYTKDKKIIKSINDVKENDYLYTVLYDGKIESVVSKKL